MLLLSDLGRHEAAPQVSISECSCPLCGARFGAALSGPKRASVEGSALADGLRQPRQLCRPIDFTRVARSSPTCLYVPQPMISICYDLESGRRPKVKQWEAACRAHKESWNSLMSGP
eukprot:15458573-Alexandrium_andersonii.AAC.1